MASWARSAGAVTCILLVGVVVTSCGSGLETAATTTTTLSVEDQRLAGEYATALQRLLRIRQLPGVDAAEERCAGDAVVTAVGLDRFREARLSPSEVTSVDSLADGGVDLSDREIDALGVDLASCLPDDLGARLTQSFGFGSQGELQGCLATVMLDLMGVGLARQVAHGLEPMDTVGFAEGLVAGIRCRWKSQPERPSSAVTLDDGTDALAAALTEELATPPPDLDAPTLASDELDCFVPDVIDTLEEGLTASEATAREIARYLSGEGPEAMGFEVSPEQADELADAYLDCIGAEGILRAQLEFAGAPDDLIDDLLACLAERLPEDNLRENLALNYELGAAAQATDRGQDLLLAQAEAGRACAREVQSAAPTSS